MSSGLWHNRATITSTVLASGVTAMYEPTIAICLLFGGMLGILLTPDLDQPTLNRIENQLVKNYNPLVKIFGLLYIGFFAPYSRLFPHRSFWTHFPLIGTIGRVIYMCVMLGTIRLCAYLIDYAILYFDQIVVYKQYALYGLIMLCTVDFIHYIMDYYIQIK